MSATKLVRDYKCWNDCVMEGCPGHKATLHYQSVSDAFSFLDGKGGELHGQTPEFGALLSMIYELSGSRTEVESMIKEAKELSND